MPRGGGTSSGKGLGGFFKNFFEDARDTVTGIPLGLYNLGQGVAHDTAMAATLGAWDPGKDEGFKTDDIAKGIGSYYWNDSPIGALLQGDLGGAADRAYKNPFSTALDAFSVASLGAGAATKAGVLAKTPKSITTSVPAHAGLEYTKRLSSNPLSARMQMALSARTHAKAMADPSSRAASRITRKAYLDAFRKESRLADEIAGQYGRTSDALVAQHGELGELASAVKASGMSVDDVIEGYARVLRGEQKSFLEESASTLTQRAKKLGGGAAADELVESARDALERSKAYDLSSEAQEALKARLSTLSANRDQIAGLVESPEVLAWYEQAKTLSRETEDAYRASNPRFYEAAQKSDEAALQTNREFIESKRTSEWNLLHPDRDVPDYVRENALYRPHKDIEDAVSRVKGIGKSNRVAMSSRKRTGKRFLSGLDDPNPRHLLEAYIEQREAGLHNHIRASLADHATPMTRAEFVQRVKAGEDIVNIGHDPKLVRQFQKEAELVRKIGSTVDEGTAGVIGELADEVESVATMLEQGGRFADKKVVAVPRTVFESLRREPGFATNAVGRTLVKATDYWRHLVLSYRAPQWMLNNAVGQAMLLAFGAGPAKGSAELYRLLRDSKLGEAVDDVAAEITSTAPGLQLTKRASKYTEELPKGKVARAGERFLRGGEAVGRFNAKYADDPFRKARFVAYARKDIDALKASGKAADDADAVRQLAKNTDWLDDAIQATLDDMIDFGSMSHAERVYLRNVFPFYSWMKGSAKVAGRHLRDKPVQAQGISNLSDAALDQQEERFGALPSFMQGGIPVPDFLQNDSGSRFLSTSGVNPFMSPVDSASALGQFIPGVGMPESYGGESLIAQMNPFIKAPIGAMTGTDPFFGGDLGGRPLLPLLPYSMQTRGDFLLGQLLNVPQTKLVGDLASESSANSMYDRSAWHPLLQFFGGLPVKDVRLGQARQRAIEELASAGPVSKS